MFAVRSARVGDREDRLADDRLRAPRSPWSARAACGTGQCGAGLLAGGNWNKPGQEWGAGYVFTTPGCWDLHADRGSAYADVWIRVIKR